MKDIEMKGVQEYAEGMPVYLTKTDGIYAYGVNKENWKGNGRLVIKAFNEAGCNITEVDLIQLIEWVKENKPEILTNPNKEE